jgi:mono/diheme cytochrome c family protein
MKSARLLFLCSLVMTLIVPMCSMAQHDQIDHGRHLFEMNSCIGCHGKNGKTPYDLTARLDSLSDNHLREFIKDPAGFGNRTMPAFKAVLSDSDLNAIIAYVRTLSSSTRRKD